MSHFRFRFAAFGFALAAGISQSAHAQAQAQQIVLPATPVGNAVREWLDAFNGADSARLGAYYRRYRLQRVLSVQMERRATTGGFDLVSIERSEPRLLEFVVRERSSGQLAVGVSELTEGDAPSMKMSALQAIPRGATLAAFRIDAAARAQVIESAISKLDENYVFPDVAAKMAAAVRDRQKRGEYDKVTNGITFASLLTEHFREVSRDRHLGVNFVPGGVPDRRPGGPDSAQRARYRDDMLRVNCGFEKAEKLEGNIGYLKFNFFADPEVCGPKATEAMQSLAGVDALIVDLRENGGGDPSMVAFVSSYLFSKRTHLNDLWERRNNKTEEFWTNPNVAGTKIRDETPIYVLTANRTFSGAEEFSYNLKNLKRATIVGETTGGGAHPVSGHKLSDRFQMGVPFARAINPISKTNWEGTGVEPDIKVPAAQALETAKGLIRERKIVP